MFLPFFCQPLGQGTQPVQFVRIFFRSNRLSIGDVGTDDADIVDSCGNNALLLIREKRIVFDDIRYRFF